MMDPLALSQNPSGPQCWHILNGDAVVANLPSDLGGAIIVWREALMDGPISAWPDESFWDLRAAYIAQHHDVSEETYRSAFMSQLALIGLITPADDVVFWFEDDLFCQVNFWMAMHVVHRRRPVRMYRVFPSPHHGWSGFGHMDGEEAAVLFGQRVMIGERDVALMQKLLEAYADANETVFRELARRPTHAMRHLPAVIDAHLLRLDPDMERRMPDALLRQLVREGHQTFADLFTAFTARAGVYGYGDTQIRVRLNDMGLLQG
jgi:hypothetical protein